MMCAKSDDTRILSQLPNTHFESSDVMDIKNECIEHGSYRVYEEIGYHDGSNIDDAYLEVCRVETMIKNSHVSDQRLVGWTNIVAHLFEVYSLDGGILEDYMTEYNST